MNSLVLFKRLHVWWEGIHHLLLSNSRRDEVFCSSHFSSSSPSVAKNSSCCGLGIVLFPSASFISSARWGLDNGTNLSEAGGSLTCFGLVLLWSFEWVQKLCTHCFHVDTLLVHVRVFLELKFLPVLLLSPLDMYALIDAWRQDKFSSPLLSCFALLTFGDLDTKELKRPWRGVKQECNISWKKMRYRAKNWKIKSWRRKPSHATNSFFVGTWRILPKPTFPTLLPCPLHTIGSDLL